MAYWWGYGEAKDGSLRWRRFKAPLAVTERVKRAKKAHVAPLETLMKAQSSLPSEEQALEKHHGTLAEPQYYLEKDPITPRTRAPTSCPSSPEVALLEAAGDEPKEAQLPETIQQLKKQLEESLKRELEVASGACALKDKLKQAEEELLKSTSEVSGLRALLEETRELHRDLEERSKTQAKASDEKAAELQEELLKSTSEVSRLRALLEETRELHGDLEERSKTQAKASDEKAAELQEDFIERAKLQDWSFSLKTLRHVRIIGVGSFGSVRMVEHVQTGARYALKRIKKENGKVPGEVQEECKVLASVSHPFMLQMVKFFETEKGVYILTELVTGGQLYDKMQEITFTVEQQAFYIASVILVFEVLHGAGILYRDLKPENVMLDHEGFVKLVDFGAAKELHGKTHTITGTPHYMAPEIFRGGGYAFEVDIWSVGILLYEMACGKLPFGHEAETEDQIITAILEEELLFPLSYNDNAGKTLIKRFLTKNPSERIQRWAEVKDSAFFEGDCDLFAKILNREMNPPLAPQGEEFPEENQLMEEISLSDAEELASQ